MIWLGLDLGSVVGWCMVDTESWQVWWGHEDFTKYEPAERVVQFGLWLDWFLVEGYDGTGPIPDNMPKDLPYPTHVAWEEPKGESRRGQLRVTYRMEGVLLWLARHLPALGVHPSTLKQWATGSGNATKTQMRDAAIKTVCAWAALERGRPVGTVIPSPADRTPSEGDEADATMVAAWAIWAWERRVLP